MATIRSTVLLCLGFITIVVAMFVVSVTRTPQLSEQELRAAGVFVLPQPRALAEFQLQDQFGESFALENLENKWTFIFFGLPTVRIFAPLQWQSSDGLNEHCITRAIWLINRCREFLFRWTLITIHQTGWVNTRRHFRHGFWVCRVNENP